MGSTAQTGAVLFVKGLEKVAAFYEKVAGLRRTHTGADHVVLRLGSYELVVHLIPADVAGPDFVESPIAVREDCCLKLVFFTKSISSARKVAARLGGLLNGREFEWRYEGTIVCDGCDPEGNVVQMRQRKIVNKPLKKRRARKTARPS